MHFLVVDDDELLARTMQSLLSPFGDICPATSVQHAVQQLSTRTDWSAFFIDLRLPDGSGIDVLGHLRAFYPTTPAMVLTCAVDAHAINLAFDLGADYVLKPVEQPRIMRFIASHQDFGGRLKCTLRSWRERYSLSDAEVDVLHRAAFGESREEIAASRGSSLLTIKTHVGNLLQKTGDHSLHAAVTRVLRSVAGDPRAA